MITFGDVIHLYIGCKVKYPDTDGKTRIDTLCGVDWQDNGIILSYARKRNGCRGAFLSWEPNGNHNSDALHVKPILRHLDDITEEECRELYKITTGLDWKEEEGYESCFGNHWMQRDECYSKRINLDSGNPMVWAKLLSWGFDLFNLLLNGHAIRKEAAK